MDIRSMQKLVAENKRQKGFNLTDVPLEVCLLQGEVAEFFQAWRHKRDDMGEELADIAIYLLGLAEIVGVDLEAEITDKIDKNARRVYVDKNGVLVKAGEVSPS